MKIRSLKKSNWFLMACVIALMAVLCAGVRLATAGPPEVPEERPLAALRTVAWNATGITVDTNSSANLTQHYAYHDIFCSVDIHSSGGVTITVQSSPAGTTYYDTYELAQITSDTDVFTRVLSYGRYERVNFDVNDTGLITPTCTSIFFNDWYPASYVETVE